MFIFRKKKKRNAVLFVYHHVFLFCFIHFLFSSTESPSTVAAAYVVKTGIYACK